MQVYHFKIPHMHIHEKASRVGGVVTHYHAACLLSSPRPSLADFRPPSLLAFALGRYRCRHPTHHQHNLTLSLLLGWRNPQPGIPPISTLGRISDTGQGLCCISFVAGMEGPYIEPWMSISQILGMSQGREVSSCVSYRVKPG